jgi:hypothetical protein
MRGILAAAVVLSTSAAEAKSLNIPLEPQHTPMWCWAASGQMVMRYVAGAEVPQCDQANVHFARTDCCQSPTPQDCVKGGHADYSYWGVDSQAHPASLTFEQLKAEIDANRPVGFRWAWTGGGAHLMVIIGYQILAGEQMLLVNNPWPPDKGVQKWISYAEYLQSPTHTQSGNDLGFVDAPHCAAEFVGLAAAEFQRCFDEWSHRGTTPVTLASDGTVVTGAFVSGAGGPVHALISGADMQSFFDTYTQQGFRPLTIDVASGAPRPYSAVWTKAEAPFVTHWGYADVDLAARHTALTAQGYAMVDLFTYDTMNGPRFVATWVKGAPASTYTIAQSDAQYATELQARMANGERPSRFSLSAAGAAALWVANAHGFYHYRSMSAAEVQTHEDALGKAGYALSHASIYAGKYSAIWVKP